jgi:hypothetical protein
MFLNLRGSCQSSYQKIGSRLEGGAENHNVADSQEPERENITNRPVLLFTLLGKAVVVGFLLGNYSTHYSFSNSLFRMLNSSS